MKSLHVTATGIRPLIMSNPQTVDIENKYSIESRRLGGLLKKARKKEDESMMQELAALMKRNDFFASAYYDDKEKKFFLPDTVILACIKEAAKSQKKGKDIDRSVLMEETQAYISNVPKAASLEAAAENEAFYFDTPAKIPPKTGSLIYKRRCIMPTGWQAAFQLTFDDTAITTKLMAEIVTYAGASVGVGGWRPKFGRFTVEIGDV